MSRKKAKQRNVRPAYAGNVIKDANSGQYEDRGLSSNNRDWDENSSAQKCQRTAEKERIRSFGQDNRNILPPSGNDENIVPRWILWIVVPLTMVLRVWYVLEPRNWWILHPDEVFQTIEAAHTVAYGYGFLAYEYLPPLADVENTTLSDAQKLGVDLGMYSLRSLILPKLLSWVMLIADYIGVHASPFLVIKTFHATMTSLLPLSVYWFSHAWFQSTDVAIISAVFVASSLTLNIFGTHTFINSFLSPVIFISLVPLLHLLFVKDNPASSVIAKTAASPVENNENEKLSQERETTCTEDEWKAVKTQIVNELLNNQDENANVVFQSRNEDKISKMSMCVLVYRNLERNTFNRFCSMLALNTLIGDVKASLRFVFVFDIIYFISGLILAICIYIRLDVILMPSFLILTNASRSRQLLIVVGKSQAINYLLGATLGTLCGGLGDYVTYGRWFLSPLQWFLFNVWNNNAGGIFGTSTFSFYVFKLRRFEPWFTFLFLLVLLQCVGPFLCRSKSQKNSLKCRWTKILNDITYNQSFVLFVLLLFSFSFNSHKELRFLHNVIVFFYISVACVIHALFKACKKVMENQNCFQFFTVCMYIFIALLVSSHVHSFSHMSRDDQKAWSYGNDGDSQNANMCLEYIRGQNDANGVFIDYPIYKTGAYSILHKPMPIFVKNINEYTEYKYETFGNQKQVMVFNRISDFVSIYNVQYMYSLLRQKTVYNYLILEQHVQLPSIYGSVYEVGNLKVWKRKQYGDPVPINMSTEKKLLMGSNATVLEHEGYWLNHFGLYEKAEQRLIAANRLEPTRVGVFRLLLEMYRKLNQRQDYVSVLSACQQVYSMGTCLEPYVPSRLHEEYYRDVLVN